jgi:hypothetical protein
MFGGRFRFLAGSYAGLLSPFGPLVASLMFMPYNHLRTLTFQPKNELERFQIVPTCRTPLPSGQHARRPHLSAATLARVVLAKVTVRSVEVAGRLSRGGGAHIGPGGRVGGCVARRARKACKDDGQGRGCGLPPSGVIEEWLQ